MLIRKPIPNTKWSLVTTTEGNEFYYNSETKQSVWEVPEEIAELVKQMKEDQKSHDKGIKRKAEDDDESMTSEDVKRAKGTTEVKTEGTE